MRSKQSEKYIERKLNAAVKAAGGRSIKMSLIGERGFPDRVLVLPGGRTLYVEVKGTGKSLDPLQRVWRDRLLALDADWHFLDHTDDIPLIIGACYVRACFEPAIGISNRDGRPYCAYHLTDD